MCCSDDDCADIFLMMLRCIVDQNKKFLVRFIIGVVFDGFECLSFVFQTNYKDVNIYLIILMAILYAILFGFVGIRSRRKKIVYKFNYLLFFKLISLGVAIVIFYTTSGFDWSTFTELYTHFADWKFEQMFLTGANIVSLVDIILNFSCLMLMIFKLHKAVKNEKSTYRKLFFKSYDVLGKSDIGACEGPNQQSVSSVTTA